MEHRISHHPNYQSMTATSTTGTSSCRVYTGMGDTRLTFTYLTANGSQTVDVSALMPDTVYRYLCRCGCGEEFKATGSKIQNDPVVTGGVVTTPSCETSETKPAANTALYGEPVTVTTPTLRTIHIDESKGGDKTGLVLVAKEGNRVACESVEEDESEEPTEPFDTSVWTQHVYETPMQAVRVTAIEKDPAIGDKVWSKATGAGPFVILAATKINVEATELLIKVNDGDDLKEAPVRRSSSDTKIKQLDAWLVRTWRGKTATFPQAEMTCQRQHPQLSLTKILVWAATFATFATAGWLLHH